MTYGRFQRVSDASAYSKMRKEQIESDTTERKKILNKCEKASRKIDSGNKEGVEELFQALQEYGDLVDSQDKK
jgi:hypothetical protein